MLASALLAAVLNLSGADATRVPLRQQPLPIDQVGTLGGYVGQRLLANRDGYLKPFDIDQFTRMVETRAQRDWWWIGEQPGKWLESAALTARQTQDTDLEKRARSILARLVAAQEPSGYLGITAAAARTPEKPLRGMDPYELYFLLHGLITAHEQWGDPQALAAARGLADYFANHIGPGKAEFWPSPYRPPENQDTIICSQYTWVPEGTRKAPVLHNHSEIAGHTAHYGWEGTLLLDPMLRLHQVTGDPRYRAWGEWVVASLDRWSGWNAFSKLDQVADGKLGVHQLQPYVHAHTFQMNFIGFLRLYQITGDASLLRKVRGAWDDVARRQLYITGGVSVGEHYEPGFRRPTTGHVVETCANMSWMELTQYLLTLTGDAPLGDAIERLLFNHVFASQTIDGDCYRYHTPPNGFKPDDYFHGPDCCTSSGHRLASLLPQFLYAQDAEGPIINQFAAGTADFKLAGGAAVRLTTETGYPETEAIRWQVRTDRPQRFTLKIRVPGWCDRARLTLNGQPQPAPAAGTYARLEREWRTGDRVELVLPMAPRWVTHDHYEGETPPYALVRGPVVYALDTVWWDEQQAPLPYEVGREAGLVLAENAAPHALPAPPRGLGPTYEAVVSVAGNRRVKARFVPFTNIGRWYRDGQPRPDQRSRAFSYAVWLPDAASPAFLATLREQDALRDLQKNSLDFVLVGNAASERAHKLAGERMGAGQFQGRNWRHAGEGGNIRYELKVSTEEPTALIVTYWGGETGSRKFDLLANGTRLGTQTLNQNRPGEFFEVTHPIPFSLTQGKTDALGQKVDRVTIEFRALPGAQAGGVFGVRTVVQKPE